MRKIGKYRLTLLIVGLAIILGASLPPSHDRKLSNATANPSRNKSTRKLANARCMELFCRRTMLLLGLRSQFPRTKAAALAKIVRARIRIKANDYAGAAALLDSNVIRDHSLLTDYALFMRANAFEQTGRSAEARALYVQLARDYPRLASGQGSHVGRGKNHVGERRCRRRHPRLDNHWRKKTMARRYCLLARAHEQASDPTRALQSYRRLYFYAPASAESAEAASCTFAFRKHVGPGSAEEALARADGLYQAKKFSDATQAYGDAFARFPGSQNSEANFDA